MTTTTDTPTGHDALPFTASELDGVRHALDHYRPDEIIPRLVATIDSVPGGTVDLSPEEIGAIGAAAEWFEGKVDDLLENGQVKDRGGLNVVGSTNSGVSCAGACSCERAVGVCSCGAGGDNTGADTP